MPRAEIASKQAKHTLQQLHAELAGKLLENKKEAKRLTLSMMQVEALMKMLRAGFDVPPIAVLMAFFGGYVAPMKRFDGDLVERSRALLLHTYLIHEQIVVACEKEKKALIPLR